MKTTNKVYDPAQVVGPLSDWMGGEYKSFFRVKSISPKVGKNILKRSQNFIESNQNNAHFKILFNSNRAIAVVTLYRHPNPRVKNQQLVEFYYDPQLRKKALPWLQEELKHILPLAPKATTININPPDESFLRKVIEKSGFNIRYELLVGETKKALRELIKKKDPSENLDHLGLKIRVLKNTSELPAAMKLQRKVAKKFKQHTYYSHTESQLKKDREQYTDVLRKKNGLILGIYRSKTLVGLVITTISTRPEMKLAGFSFFLDESVQGKGTSTTAYLLLLRFLEKRKVPLFIGGTSQPAIKSLGKIMKREVAAINYVKMDG
jgi:hypothetical protein